MFREIYESPVLHPVLFWAAGALFLLAVSRKLPFLYAYLVAFGVEILADATLTSPWTPVPPRTGLATVVAIGFVILGDFRYFVLLFRAQTVGPIAARGWLAAAGLSLVVPVLSVVVRAAFPTALANMQVTFLTYELMFFALVLAIRLRLPRGAPHAAWARWATSYELLQYGLWVAADVAILSGYDAGFLVRILPNLMYYVLYLPFVAWLAPRALAEPWQGARP